MLKSINAAEAQSHFNDILTWAEQGDEIEIIRENQPAIRLVAKVAAPKQRTLDLHKGKVVVHDDFDEPLGDAFWLGEE